MSLLRPYFEGFPHRVHCVPVGLPLVEGACGHSWAVGSTVLCGAQPHSSAQLYSKEKVEVFFLLGTVTVFPLVVNMCCCVLSFISSCFNWGEVNLSQSSSVRFPRGASGWTHLRESLVLWKCCLATRNAQFVQNMIVLLYLCFFCRCLSANICEHWWSLISTFTAPSSVFHVWAEYAGLWFFPWSTGDTSSSYTYKIKIQSHGSSARHHMSSVTRAVIT